jgi:23S rRNA (cytosine1962-C5)-methyltransferase
MNADPASLLDLLESACSARQHLFEPAHQNAFRLFNGFLEGCPELVIDIYGSTAVLFDHSDAPEQGHALIAAAVAFLREKLPWLRAGLLKRRGSPNPEERRGRLLFGERPADRIRENGVWYALDLRMNQDASFYLDTRTLRQWAKENLAGKTVLNTFAYTGSLGVAARAGGATRVVQMDLNRQFLNLAKVSYTLNGFPIHKADWLTGDFFPLVSRLKREGELFDCVFIDPPFFSTTPGGVVDLAGNMEGLINKVRPLIADGGRLVAVNNALFVSGKEYYALLESLCRDGYLKIAELIPVPEDFTGYSSTRAGSPVTDPAPFNHSTKMAVLEVRRKN